MLLFFHIFIRLNILTLPKVFNTCADEWVARVLNIDNLWSPTGIISMCQLIDNRDKIDTIFKKHGSYIFLLTNGYK